MIPNTSSTLYLEGPENVLGIPENFIYSFNLSHSLDSGINHRNIWNDETPAVPRSFINQERGIIFFRKYSKFLISEVSNVQKNINDNYKYPWNVKKID